MTRFHDLFAEQGLPALLEHHGETIEYRSVDQAGTGPWRSGPALVQEDTPELPLDIGISAPGYHRVIVVTIARTDPAWVALTCVSENRDRICFDEIEYTVKKILREDSAHWRLYCVR